MASPQDSSNAARIREILCATALAAGAIVVSIYAVNRLRRYRETQELVETLPPVIDALANAASDHFVEPAESMLDDAGEQHDMAVTSGSEKAFEELTVGELYLLAQRHDIAGRSTMRKAQLIAALRAVEAH